MSEYALFFDREEVRPYAETVDQAVSGCYGFLNNISADYLERDPTECEYRAWLLTYDPAQRRIVRSSIHQGRYILRNFGKLTVYLQSTHHDTLASAEAISVALHEDYRTKQAREEAIDELKIQLRHTRQTMHQHVEALKALPNPDTMRSWEESPNPKQILEAAEDRIFAHNLYHALRECTRRIDDIEKEVGIVRGSVCAMLEGIRPLRPTQEIVEKLAKALEIEPHHLWYDAVGAYDKAMGIIQEKSSSKKVPYPKKDDMPPFIAEH